MFAARNHPLITRIAAPAAVVAAFAFMLIWSHDTWPDPLVDFGTQLYVPWQMSLGKTLYRDLACYNGPFSVCFNAFVFHIFGVGIHQIEAANLLWLIAAAALLYHLINRCFGKLAAMVGGITFALVFSCGQGVGIGNYNWITPYAHELTHGITLGLAAIASLEYFHRTMKQRWLILAGIFVGAALLTKAEPGAAAMSAAIIFLLIGCWSNSRQISIQQLLGGFGIFFSAVLAAIMLTLIALCTKLPIAEATRGIAGSWRWVFDRRITSLSFYRGVMGTDDIPANLAILLDWATGYASLAIAAIFLSLRTEPKQRITPWIIFILTTGLLWIASHFLNLNLLATPLPFFLLTALINSCTIFYRDNPPPPPVLRGRAGVGAPNFKFEISNSEDTPTLTLPRSTEGGDKAFDHQLCLRISLLIFSLALLGKILLRTRVFHYGFALAMPAALMLIGYIVHDLPAFIRRRGGNPFVFLAAAAAVWVWAVGYTLMVDAQAFAAKPFTVMPATSDSFRTGSRGLEVQLAVQRIDNLLPPTGTLAVFPQGLMLNYLSRRAAPTPYLNFMPPEVIAAGEPTILSALQNHAPDLIVIDRSALSSASAFTLDGQNPYGQQTLQWITTHYHAIELIQLPPPYPTLYRFVFLKPNIP